MAYPILYKANETNFEHLGVSVLSDASKCYVSREKNGIYILEFDYPVNGKDVDKIKEGMLIKSDAGYRTKNQRFVVSKITKTQNEFKLYCQHISQVKTTMNAIRPDITITGSALMALSTWRDNLLDSRDEFFVNSDITTVNSTTWKVENIENARDALGGKAGSILDVWGGEYEFDNLNITLHKSMGIDNPTIIAYGKNLLDLEQERSILETYTSVFPFKKYTDDNNREQLITLPEILLDSTHLNKFTHRRILKVDFSNDENIKTVEQLRSKAKSYIKNNNVGVPKTNLKINYQDLSKVEGVFDNPALEQIDLCDRLKVYYDELGILNENAKVVKVIWDVILEENHEIEVGDGRSSFTDSNSAKIESLQVQNDSILARINALIAEQDAAFDRYFNEKSKIIEDAVKTGAEKAQLSSEEKLRKMGEAFDEKVNQFREQVSSAVENYNRQFQATNLEISKNRVEATKQIQALTDRVNNIQDISNNETVRELRGLVNGATSKVTELETSITREFTEVKKKNEDSLNAVKAEFTKGVDGLTSKISSLEEYKNQDSSRTESLKQWVQQDTANQLSKERTEINKIIDSKDFVKDTEFSNKFNESARGITNQLSALENYKNQDGVRVANMQIWAQNNTANQLTAERRNIEKWINDKGYATTSVVENKVQETANSFSRDLSNATNSINTLNSWKQTATETLNTVSSGLNDAVKHSQLRIGADKIDFGSNKVFDGRNLASMLSVSPESIQAISDRVIITPSNENMVMQEFRESATSSVRDVYLTPEITSDKLNNGDQFIIEGIGTWNGTLRYDLNFLIAIKYKSGRWTWITSRLKARGEYSNSIIPLKTTLTINGLNEEVAIYKLGLQQPDWSNFTNITFKNAKIYKKKSAELIVDGSIEGRQIKAETLETGHHKAGSITSEIIAANAVKAKHVEIDDGLIDNLVSHKAFITKLWAQDAFIKSLQTVKIKTTQLDTDFLSSYTGIIGGFRIGQNPNDKSLRWLTGQNNFRIGMSPGDANYNERSTALWVAWSDKWDTPGDRAWWVTNAGVMHSKRTPIFYNGLNVSSGVVHYANGTYTYSPNIKNFVYEQNNKGEKWVRFYVGNNGKDHRTHSQYWVTVVYSASDKRYKTNLKPTNVRGLDVINKLKCYEYDIKLPTDDKSKHINCGIMAQDVEKHANEAHSITPDDIHTYKPFEMIPYLIKAIQELSEQNKELKNKLEEIING